MENLNVGLIQSDLSWENIDANLEHLENQLANIAPTVDLVILPEMFSTGFSMEPAKVAEAMKGKTVQWLAEHAKRLGAVLTGSIIIEEEGNYYNRLVWMRPDGSYATYDKRHLFTLAGEHEVYTAGKMPLYVEVKGWKVCPLICYDLRFPVWSRNTVNYDLLIYVANWPEKRNTAWKSLLRARAIENQAYTIGVNRVGRDGNDLDYSGDSSIIDYAGALQFQVSNIEGVFTATLSYEKQQAFRKKLQFLADRDQFEIT